MILLIMLRIVLRSEGEELKPSKALAETSFWSWIFSSSDTSRDPQRTHELTRSHSQASGISPPD